MMKKIYSKVVEDCLLLTLNRREDISTSRTDLSPAEEYLQCATKTLTKGIKFRPHRHNRLIRKTDITQEAWIFLSGRVRAKFYDLDDSIILDTELGAGDCVIVFKAGHGFEVLEDDTVLYEFKTGPYEGVELDKTFID
jgi:mannose-6-phosphate isomerase-like protein (cupin superfamily)